MAANVLRAILSGSRYPANLYINTLDAGFGQNRQRENNLGPRGDYKGLFDFKWTVSKRGDDYVEINEETKDKAYVLGKLFAVLEAVQEAANPE